MKRYSIIVEWDDMPLGFKSWLLNLRRKEGLSIKQWSDRDDGVTTGLGFDVEEDSYQSNKTYIEMIRKFGNPNRKTRLKRWHIIDYVNNKVQLHEE